jgi:hypothetical protein
MMQRAVTVMAKAGKVIVNTTPEATITDTPKTMAVAVATSTTAAAITEGVMEKGMTTMKAWMKMVERTIRAAEVWTIHCSPLRTGLKRGRKSRNGLVWAVWMRLEVVLGLTMAPNPGRRWKTNKMVLRLAGARS